MTRKNKKKKAEIDLDDEDIIIEEKPKKKNTKEIEKEKSKKKKIITIILLILVFLCSVVAIYYFAIRKEVKITSEKTIGHVFKSEADCRVGEEYKDEKFSICYGPIINCKKVKYTTEGEVDTTKLGEYTLTYHYKIDGKDKTLKRVVNVYDDVKPELVVDEELSFCKNGNVGNGKYHANDNYDGDITDKVKLTIEGDKAYLEVEDTSGNKESIEVAALEFSSDPVISLNGETTKYIFVGNSYNDQGATATDKCDGDISDKIITSGSVNANAKGTYTITYSVENSDGKKAEATRKVIVQARASVANGSSCNKPGAIYLTFDDGPQNGTTNVILDILKDEGVKATFFVTNKGPDSLIKREYDEGHVVALHTASHEYSIVYRSVDSYFKDLKTVQDRVKRITGVESKIIRFPGGSSNTISRNYQRGIMTTLTNEVISRGYRYHDWNVDSNDAGACAGGSSSCVYSYVVNSLSKNRCNMVLMHDIKWYTRDALRDIIKYGKNNGYTFEVITMDTPMVTQRVNN